MDSSSEAIDFELWRGFSFVRDDFAVSHPEASVVPAVFSRFHFITREVALVGNVYFAAGVKHLAVHEELRYVICRHVDFIAFSFAELHSRPWISCYHSVVDIDAFLPASCM